MKKTNNHSRSSVFFFFCDFIQRRFAFRINLNKTRKKNKDGTKNKQIFFFFSSAKVAKSPITTYELLLLGLISFTLRPGGNDCLSFSAFSLSATITKTEIEFHELTLWTKSNTYMYISNDCIELWIWCCLVGCCVLDYV